MKKGTLAILLLAVALGGYVYYSEFRHPQPKTEPDSSKSLFTFAASDIAALKLTRPAGVLEIERQDADWKISQPVAVRADRSALDAMALALAGARSTRSLPADTSRLKEYGLDSPSLTVEIRLKSGQQHLLRLGAKDFSGDGVYTRLDNDPAVLLLPATVFTSADKSLDDLRDRAILSLASWELKEIEIRKSKDTLRLEKKDGAWSLLAPRTLPADDSAVTTLSGALSGGKYTDVAVETAKEFSRYGLASPAITVRVKSEKGEEGTLQIGKKVDGKYFARDASRPLVFRVEQALVDSLSVSVTDLRDKRVVRFRQDDIVRVQFHDAHGEVTGVRGAAGKWVIDQPAERKGKEMLVWKIFDPLSSLRAKEVFDAPGGAILAKLAKPATVVELVDKAGKVTKVSISAADGQDVYVRTNLAPTVFKVDRFILQELNLPAADLAPQ